MKQIFLTFFVLLLSAISCQKFDDSLIWDKLNDHETRISELEKLCKKMNEEVVSLQTIVTALQNNDYVTGVQTIKEGESVIGYTISFTKSVPITIYHGKDGKDGKDGITPIIGVKQDNDGIYYWTLNGNWLLDNDGNKLRAQGKDGIDGTPGNDGIDGVNGVDGINGVTPKLKIEEGFWYISYDDGESWTIVGQAQGDKGETGPAGDSFFEDVNQDSENVYFTLKDGTVLTVPLASCDLLSLLKSISYIPAYSDGKATVLFVKKEDSYVEMTFEVSPKNVVEAIAENWDNILSLKAVNTITRSIDFIELPILSCEANSKNGTINIKASCSTLSDAFFDGTQSVSVRLSIADKTNEIISSYIALVPERTAKTTEYFVETTYRISESNKNVLVYNYRSIAGENNPVVCVDYGDGTYGTEYWHSYKSAGEYKVIFYCEQPITEIAKFSFQGIPSLRGIVIPATVKTIGECAFFSGTSKPINEFLENVTFEADSQLTTLKFGAFACLPNLYEIKLPSSLENIEEKVFMHCPSLARVYATGKYHSISTSAGGYVYYEAEGRLEPIVIFPANTGCEDYVMMSMPVKFLSGAITNHKTLKSMYFMGGITEIDSSNFLECNLLQKVDLDKTTKIGDDVFVNCPSLLFLDMPKVSEIGVNSICNNESLESIVFSDENLKTINSVGNNNDNLREVSIPLGVTSISNSFNGSSALETIYIYSPEPPVLSESFSSVTSETKVYVPEDALEKYMNDESWKALRDNIISSSF